MDLFKKAAIGILAGSTLFILSLSPLTKVEDITQTQSATFLDKRAISIEGRQTVYQPMLLAP